MALFNLTDIKFNTSTRQGTEQLVGSQYQSNLFRFPIDLGAADKGHYIVFNINEQINTSFRGNEVSGATPTVQSNRSVLTSMYGGTDTAASLAGVVNVSKEVFGSIASTDIGQKVSSAASTAGNAFNKLLPGTSQSVSEAFGAGFSAIQEISNNIDPNIGVRTIRRISDTVAMYMPDTLNFTYNQQYEELRPGGSAMQMGLSAINSAADTLRAGGQSADLVKNLSPFLLNYITRQLGDVGKVLFTAGSGGKVNNPMMEILYSSPAFRSFRFDFMMYPRSEQEALQVQNIISRLRFHQAPELVSGSGGFFLYPPSELDISFYYNGSVNPNIPKISTCVLETIDVDYAPNGFSAYEVPGESAASVGRTGMPVAVRLSLQFKETEYLVKGSPLLDSSRQQTGLSGIAREMSAAYKAAGQVNESGQGIY